MRIIGNKLLEVIKLKQALVLILFASLLFPQFKINQITHPLDEKSSDLRDRDKSYLVHCASGGRSTRSLSVFEELQFKQMYHLEAGINGWIAAGQPVKQ